MSDIPEPLQPTARALASGVSKRILETGDDLEAVVKEQWPEEPQKSFWPFIEAILQGVDFAALAAGLGAIAAEAARRALEIGAAAEARRLQPALQEIAGDEAEVGIAFDVTDTLALRLIREHAARRMTRTSEDVKEHVRQTLANVAESRGNVQQAVRALRETVDGLSASRAWLIARTETLQAARGGAQALAESTDLIQAKRWRHSGRTGERARSWHVAMNGVVVGKTESFVVPKVNDKKQPRDYPKRAFIVGEDSPFNCACTQEGVLRDDLKTLTLDELARVKGVTLTWRRPRMGTAGTERKREILAAHGEPGESFVDMLRRLDAAGSRNQLYQELGVSKRTLYDWLIEAGVTR